MPADGEMSEQRLPRSPQSTGRERSHPKPGSPAHTHTRAPHPTKHWEGAITPETRQLSKHTHKCPTPHKALGGSDHT